MSAQFFESGAAQGTDGNSFALTDGATQLSIGRIDWGANGPTNDTLTLYAPNSEFSLGSAISSASFIVDQSTFDQLTISRRGGTVPTYFDEIRFGATYTDVAPQIPEIPEPSTIALSALGLVGFMCPRRRRRFCS